MPADIELNTCWMNLRLPVDDINKLYHAHSESEQNIIVKSKPTLIQKGFHLESLLPLNPPPKGGGFA